MKFSFSCFSSSSSSSSSFSEDSTSKCERGVKTLQSIHAYTYNELKLATNNFRSSNKIGEGGFGPVYMGTLEDGKVVAVKLLSIESKQGDGEFMAEIASISHTVSHENIVKLHGGCVDGASRFLVYDYMENNSLAQALLGGERMRAKFSWKARVEISTGIARGLAYIHHEIKPHIVHRNIKATNILLDSNFAPKISDFGLSKLFPDTITHISTRVAGTLGYLAPEYAVSGHLTRKSDVYSLVVVLLEIISGRSAVDFDLQLGVYYLAEKAWEMYKSNKLVDLVDPMLNGNFNESEAVRFLKVGLLCVQEVRGSRPHMSTAVKMMCGEMNIDDGVEISPPGHITDIREVKIGNRRRSSPSIFTARTPRIFPSFQLKGQVPKTTWTNSTL